MRVVMDTNIIISGLFWRGVPGEIYDAAVTGRYTLVVTEAILDELVRVFGYPKLAVYLQKLDKTPSGLINDIRQIAQIVMPAQIDESVIRDRNDVIILACAAGGQADCIVSGDKDLLVLKSFHDIPILDAAQFLQRLKDSQE